MPRKKNSDNKDIENKPSSKKDNSKTQEIKVIGIDLSIGKVKICLLSLNKDQKRIDGGWSSLPVNFEPISEREYDFTKGLTIAIEAFLAHHKTTSSEIHSVVFCTGGGYYMFKTFADGMRMAGGVLNMIFPRKNVYFIRSDGELIKLKDIFELPDSEASAFGCTNFLGTSLLASKFFKDGLAIDMGTISTSIIPIIDGKLDPMSSYNPAGYMKHRYTTGKHIWYGAMHTPLTYITTQARTKKYTYNLILRSCSMNTIISLLGLLDPEIANRHVPQSSKLTERETCFMRLAETIGLDINSVSKEELAEIAIDIYKQTIFKLSEIIRNILSNLNFKDFDNLKVLAAGLGQEAFIIPALQNCGFKKNQIIVVSEDKQTGLWSATSVYGIALKLLENITKDKISVNFETMDMIV